MGPDERLFLRVVDVGSMKRVAAEIGTDPSTVSRRLAQLEDRLEVKLLQRSTRRTTATDAGHAYSVGLRRLFEELDALEANVAGTADIPSGKLVVTAPADFGVRFVAPVVGDMQRTYADLSVELMLGSSFFDMTEQGVDVAVRIGNLSDSTLRARRLGAVPRVIVATPAYLDRHRRPQTASDLEKHNFIGYRRPLDPRLSLEGPEGPEHVVLRSRISLNSMTGIRDQVLAGTGLHWGPRWAFEDELRDGRIEQVLPHYKLPAFPLHALFHPSVFVPAKIRVAVDRLVEACAAEPALQRGPSDL